MSVPLGFSEIPQILGGHVSLVSVTTTLMLPIQKPVTRRREGASSACTTQKGTIASSASMDTTVMLFGRTAEVRCTFIQHAHSTTTTDPLFSGFCRWGTYFSLFSETKFHSQQMKDETGFFFQSVNLHSLARQSSRCGCVPGEIVAVIKIKAMQ